MRRALRAVALLGVCAGTAVPPAPAETEAPRLTVIGAGAGVSCAEWAASAHADFELEQWAFGFASAIAAAAQMRDGGDPLARMDADAAHAWLADHCRRRPEVPLSAALVRMVLAATR